MVFAASLLFYLAAFSLLKHSFELPGDTVGTYSPTAVNIATGHGYTMYGIFVDRVPPVFSTILAGAYRMTGVMGTSNGLYPIVVLVVGSLSVCLIYLIVLQSGSRRLALFAAVVFGTHPAIVALTTSRYAWNAMPLFLLFFHFAWYLAIRAQRTCGALPAWLSGLALGVATLTWPGGLLAWMVLVVFLARPAPTAAASRVKLIAMLMAGFLIPVAGWAGVVHHTTGRLIVSTGAVFSMVDGMTLQGGAFAKRAAMSADAQAFDTIPDVLRFYASEFTHHTLDTTAFVSRKMVRVWYGQLSGRHEIPVALIQAPYLLLAGWGVRRAFRRREPHRFLWLGVIGYFWVVTLAVCSVLRYMLPAMGAVAAFAAVALERVQYPSD